MTPITPLITLWRLIINDPDRCSREYERLWTLQRDAPHDFYLKIRGEFNADSDPIKLLFLMVRCAKNAIRFNSCGHFNQSPDKRRLGRHPQAMRKHLFASSFLLRKKTKFT